MSSSACDWAIDRSSITSVRVCRSAGQSGRVAGPREDLRLGPRAAFEAVARHVAHDRVVLTDQKLRLPLAAPARSCVELPALVADLDQRVELFTQARHQPEHDLLLPGQLFDERGPPHIFLPRRGRGGRGLLGLPVECRQQRAGLVEVARHGLP